MSSNPGEATLLRLGLEFESWGGHSVTPLTDIEPNILKTNDVPTGFDRSSAEVELPSEEAWHGK